MINIDLVQELHEKIQATLSNKAFLIPCLCRVTPHCSWYKDHLFPIVTAYL